MPQRPGKACRQSGCKQIVRDNKYQGYCEKHKDKAGWFRNERVKGNRHKRGYDSQWSKIRKLVLERDKGLCVPCYKNGRTTGATQVDHIKPKEHGGTDDLSNLQSICAACHRSKTAIERMGRG